MKGAPGPKRGPASPGRPAPGAARTGPRAPGAPAAAHPGPRAGAAPPATSVRAPRGTLVVNGYSERWLRQDFAWVYPNEVVAGDAAPGALVALRSASGDDLGVGIADEGWIRVRRFRSSAGPIDAALIAGRVERAVASRARLGLLTPGSAARLVNAESDDLPGVRVDRWGPSLVISLDSPSLTGLLPDLAAALSAVLEREWGEPPVSVHVGWRPDTRDNRAWPAPPGLVRGVEPGSVTVNELGLRYLVEPQARKDVGLFPDQRDNRAWLGPHYRGTSVLNLFCYTGAFSVHALANGAREVTSVDLSRPYLDRLDQNLALNGLDPALHTRVEDDALKVLDRLRRQGRTFDRVILDPPGHSHSGGTDWSGEQDYARLVAAAARVTRPGGWIIASSNLGSVSPRQFQGAVIDGLRKASCTGRVLHTGGQAPDFAAGLHVPEGSFLKFLVVELAGGAA